MLNRNARSGLLAILALANLVCWVGVAIVIVLVIGDSVDLGVETLIREGQATAVAMWEQASRRELQSTAIPPIVAQAQQPAQPKSVQNAAPATITWPAPSTPLSNPEPTAVLGNSQELAATSDSPDPLLTPEPEATLISSPLLMANPEMNSMAALRAELSRSAPDRAVQIRLQEDALNRELTALWEKHPELPYRDVQIDLKPAGVIVTGNATVFGFEVNAQISGQVVAQDCLPHFEISNVSVAGLMTPQIFKDKIGDMIHRAMTWYPANYPLCLEQIVLEENRATVYGYRR
jgi:hypothetical protein